MTTIRREQDNKSSYEDLFDFSQDDEDVDAILKNLNSDDELPRRKHEQLL